MNIRIQNIWRNLFPFVLVLLFQNPMEAFHRIADIDSGNRDAIVGQDTTQSQAQLSSGKLSRRAKAALRRSSLQQSQAVAIDTSRAVLEYIRSLPRDSSARIAQFKYVRRDKPGADGIYHKSYSLFLGEPSAVKYQASLDSNKWVYHLQRTVGGYNTRIPLEVPFEQYIALRQKQVIRQNWESMAQFYQLAGETKTTLGDVFGMVTKIEIPVPKNPIFSIFGPNIIRLNINGGVDIHGAFRNTKSDQYTASPLGQNRNEPDFNQQVQVTVKGIIGDKLNIDADWNTQRTFDYENQLKVRYQGYDDEIIQSIEAGNVSLSTNSSFISSSQALFGIKAQFQFGPLHLTTIASQKKGQIKELSVSGGAQSQPFEKQLTDYSTDHYFIDTVYIGEYENNFFKIPAVPNPYLQIRDIEVWVSREQQIEPSKERNVIAFMDQAKVLSILQLQQTNPDSFNIITKSHPDPVPGELEPGIFVMLDQNTDYNYNANAGIITLNKSLQANQAIAVAYVVTSSNSQPVYIGQFGSRTPKDSTRSLIMKLVRPKNLGSQMKTAWRMMLKNRYFLGGHGIKQEGFDLHIEYQPPGQPAVRDVLSQNIGLLEMFGLDRYTGQTTSQPDKVFDYFPGVTIDETRGEVIFPTVEPFRDLTIARMLKLLEPTKFATDADAKAAADSFAFNAVYDTTYNGAMSDQRNRFYLRGVIKPAQSATYNIGFNIVEGSVDVIVDGIKATSGVDYTVDYIAGQVVIKNQTFLVPGKNLQIKYEANDLFQLASKSLTGARADLNLSKSTALGFTIMNLNQQSLSDKVRLGEEPISNMIMGVDGGTSFDAPWLTNALNFLPGIKTAIPSQITFRGEAAYMKPNPNTRTSPIPQDGGKGVAYIDDFEGSRQLIPLGVIFTQWKDASPPWYIPNLDHYQPADGRSIPTTDDYIANGSIFADTTKIQYKSRACWFNIVQSDVGVQDVWGTDPVTGKARKSVAPGEDRVSVLNFYFKPAERGEFNYSMNLDTTIGLDNTDSTSHTKAWAGMQQVIGTTSTNLLDQNIGFIELWVYVVQCKDNAKLNIDLGHISERVIPSAPPSQLRGGFHTEDGLDGSLPHGILNPAYDWGLDGLNNTAEYDDPKIKAFVDYYYTANSTHKAHKEYKDDPSGDDYLAGPNNVALTDISVAEAFNKANGTEGNGQENGGIISGRFPDTEDLNNNGVLDRVNQYFEYELPLDTASNKFQRLVTGNGGKGWYQIRIPLSDYDRRIGDPSLDNVEGIRLWVTNAQQPVLFRVAEFNLVGNQWEKPEKTDTSYEISVVNYEDNPSYNSPPGVFRQRDLTRPDQNILGNEQSLSLIVRQLKKGENKQAIRRFNSRPLDVFNYRAMKMFVHGELGDAVKGYKKFGFNDSTYDAAMFMRFGDDTSNYYEYRAPIHPDWTGNDVLINFADLTAMKAFHRDTLGIHLTNMPPGATYGVRGNPRLDRILFISVGIENPADKKSVNQDATGLSGEMWVNELRLTDVDDTPGWAYRFDTSVKLADIGNIAFSYSQRDPFFHALEDHFGSRNTSQNWNLSTSFNFERLLPESWNGSSLGFSYSHTEAMNKPRYIPGTDILVDVAAQRVPSDSANEIRISSEDMNVTDTYAAPNIKLNVPLKTWLITETINKMSFGYTYTESHLRSPTVEYSTSWNWGANFRYGTQFGANNYVTPFSYFGDSFLLGLWKNLKVYYTPKQLNFGATLSRSELQSQTRLGGNANPIVHNLSAQRSMGFDWQFFDGGFLNLGLDYQVDISSSLYDRDTYPSGHERSLIAILSDMFFSERLIYFGIDQNYGQSINFNTKLVVPQILMMDKIFTPSLRYTSRYSWTNNITAGPLGKSAGWGAGPSFSLDINMKPIRDKIWPSAPTAAQTIAPTTAPTQKTTDTTAAKKSVDVSKTLDELTRTLFKTPFFDFERFSIAFTQQNSAQNSGVLNGPGFANLFARMPFFQSSLPENGPSLLYQLGLSSDPNGKIVFYTKPSFPFLTDSIIPGIRAPNGQMSDMYSQSNRITMTTSRPLWEGAQLQLNWSLGWTYNQNMTDTTDSRGNPSMISRNVSGDVDRSFVTLPPVLFFKVFKTSLDNVNEKFKAMHADPTDTRSDQAKLSQAFEDGLEAFPFMKKIIGNLAPRANWSIRWDGLEKFSLFSSFASRVSLEHTYNSNYRERWNIESTGDRVTTSQDVAYGFSPLVGVTITFKEFVKGSMSAIFRYNTTTDYVLSPSIQNVTGSTTSDISITATFSRQGFELPFFGLSLSNDIDISFNYTTSKISSRLYDFTDFKPDGSPMGGTTRTTLEPRIRYTLSARVTASLYYRYTKIAPDAGGSATPGSTINEGGLDVHVAIQ